MSENGKLIPPSRLSPITGLQLELGMEIRAPLYDERGNLLLARHQVINSPSLLRSLREHPALFTDERALKDTIRSVMNSFEKAYRQDSRLADLPRAGVAATPGEPEPDTTFQRSDRVLERSPTPLHERMTIIERRLGGVLASLKVGGKTAHEALARLFALQEQLIRLVQIHRAGALFLVFSRTSSGLAGYSVLHSVQCAVVACDVCGRLPVSETETRALVLAALTMNVSIKGLQDQMAIQRAKASREQLAQVARHAIESAQCLNEAGVQDALWLEVVSRHHDELPYCPALNDRPPAEKLAKILQVIDRFTAALSPRGTRPARSSKDAVRSVIREHANSENDEVALDLMVNLGLYPAGTCVRLVTGAIGVVVKRGMHPNKPLVVPLMNPKGDALGSLRVVDTSDPAFAVQESIPSSMLKVRLNEPLLLGLLLGLPQADMF